MHTLIFIDPGLDVTGIAKFAWSEEKPQTFQEALGCMVFTRSIETSPDQSIESRLADIAARVALLDADEFYVEHPSYAGSYKRGKELAVVRSIAKLYLAIGAIHGGLACGSTVATPVPAPRMSKKVRHGLLADAARMADIPLPEGPRGGKREDEWDAIFGGCQELLR